MGVADVVCLLVGAVDGVEYLVMGIGCLWLCGLVHERLCLLLPTVCCVWRLLIMLVILFCINCFVL